MATDIVTWQWDKSSPPPLRFPRPPDGVTKHETLVSWVLAETTCDETRRDVTASVLDVSCGIEHHGLCLWSVKGLVSGMIDLKTSAPALKPFIQESLQFVHIFCPQLPCIASIDCKPMVEKDRSEDLK